MSRKNDLDTCLPRIHPREKICDEAERHLRDAIGEMSKKFDLTTSEYLRVLNSVLLDSIGSTLKCCIRHERHGETDTPGGWAKECDHG